MYNNYYGIPCIESSTTKSIMFESWRSKEGVKSMEKSKSYTHKDMLRLGFYLYMGTYFKNL